MWRCSSFRRVNKSVSAACASGALCAPDAPAPSTAIASPPAGAAPPFAIAAAQARKRRRAGRGAQRHAQRPNAVWSGGGARVTRGKSRACVVAASARRVVRSETRAATRAAQRSAAAHGARRSNVSHRVARGKPPAQSSEAGVWCHSSVGRPAAAADGSGGPPSPSRARLAWSGGRQRAAAGARSQASGERCALSSGPASCRSRAARSSGPPVAQRRTGSGRQMWRARVRRPRRRSAPRRVGGARNR